ncbi:PAS domain S-box protein [candidate division GN15 bacterium]|nr:PAS domain S-box protein [candidate division GN15 bacterium]
MTDHNQTAKHQSATGRGTGQILGSWLIVLGTAGVSVAAVYFGWPHYGHELISAFLLPMVAAAAMWGLRGGIPAWFMFVLGSYWFVHLKTGIDWPELFSPVWLPEILISLIATAVVGYLVELRFRVKRQIADLTAATSKLRLSQAQLQSLLNSTEQAIVLLDKQWNIAAFNQRAAELSRAMTGNTLSPGSYWREFISAELQKDAEKHVERAAEGETITVEKRPITLHGQQRWIRVVYSAIRLGDDDIAGVCVNATDITETVSVQQEREDQIAFLRGLFDAVPMPIFYKGIDGYYIDCNDAYGQFLGVGRSEIIGRKLGDIVGSDRAEPFRQHDVELMNNPGKHSVETRLEFADGRANDILVTKATYTTADGSLAGIVGTVFDIGERLKTERALRESEEKFRHTFDQSPIGAAIVGLDYHFLRVNRELCRLTGYSENELLRMTVREITHPDDRTAGRSDYDRLLSGEIDHAVVEKRYVRNDGSVVWVRKSMRLLRDADGAPLYFLPLIENISERREAERALKESEEKYRLLVEHQTDMVVKIDADGRLVFVSPSYCETFGKTEDKLLGESFLPLVHEEDREATLAAMKDLYREPYECYLEQRALTKDGWRWLAWADKAVLDDDGEVVEVIGVGRDVTVRRQAQDAMAASENKYRTFFETARDPILIMKDDVFVDCNEQSCTFFKCSRDQLVGQSPYHFSPNRQPDGRPSVAASLGYVQAAARGKAQFFPWQHKTADGELRDAEISLNRMEFGDDVYLLAIVRDVTERKRAEADLEESRRALSTLISNLPGMAYRCRNDKNWTMEFVSEGCLAITGYQPEQLVDNSEISYEGIIHPDDRQAVWAEIQRAVEQDEAFQLTYRLVTHDGQTRWAWEQGRAVRDSSGAVVALEGFISDITQLKHAEKELRLSDAVLRQLPDGIIVADTEDNVTHWLGGASRIFGYEVDEIVGKSTNILPAPDYRRELRRRLAERTDPSEPLIIELEGLRKDGTRLPLELTLKLILDDHGKPLVSIGVVRDITERRAAEDLLRESERKFRLLFESSPLGLMSVNREAEIVDVNQTLLQILGLPDHESAASLDLDSIARLSGTNFRRDIDKCLHDGQPVINELSYHFEWGGKIHIRYLLTPVRDDQGRLTGLQAMLEDITDRVLSEQELRKLSAAVNQSANAICITDIDGRIEYTNPRFSALTGYSIMELVGRSISILKSGRHGRDFYKEIWETISTGNVWSGVIQNRRKNGELFWERKSISPIFSDDGRIMNYLATSEDITIEIATQQKLAESEKMAAVGMLAAGVAHEFKNYLGGIIGNASYALEEIPEDPAVAQETLEQIIDMGERANKVAMSLLTYSKARPDDRSPENLQQLIRNTLTLVEKELRNRSIEIVTYFHDVPEVMVSAGKIQQVLLNLVINAEHAIASGGVITIALIREGSFVHLKVGDTGSGIPAEHIDKVFDPFYSTKGVWGKDAIVGSGMGLSIGRNIAREHGGDLTVQSRVGMGTTFTLKLPLQEPDGDSTAIETTVGHTPKILIFSLEKAIVRHYFESACQAGVEVLVSDDIGAIPVDVSMMADVAVCDVRFSGKVELLKFVELCVASEVPYVTVNCDAMEYQLSDIYDRAAANFADLPPIGRLLTALGVSHRTPAEPE